jgi:hypothetical protein
MLKINNKGQSLVMFVLIIPIFLLILTLIYDVGNAIYEKDRLSNTNYLTIEYGLYNLLAKYLLVYFLQLNFEQSLF